MDGISVTRPDLSDKVAPLSVMIIALLFIAQNFNIFHAIAYRILAPSK